MLITVFTDEGFGHPAVFPFFLIRPPFLFVVIFFLFLMIGDFIWLVFIFLLIVVVARRRRSWTRGDGWNGPQSPGGHWTQIDAEQTLAERFARGDIDEAEYREI